MPDFDILDCNPLPGWGRIYRSICDGASAEEVARQCALKLSRSVRQEGGLRGAPELFEIATTAIARKTPVVEILRELRTVGEAYSHRHASLGSMLLRRRLAQCNGDLSDFGTSRSSFFHELLQAVSNHALFDRIRPNLTSDRFATRKESMAWESQVKHRLDPVLASIALELDRSDDGEGSRDAPLLRLDPPPPLFHC